MAIIGVELCDAGFHAARSDGKRHETIRVGEERSGFGWPAIAHQRAKDFTFGADAEGVFFLEPRSVSDLFWEKLSHDPSDLSSEERVPSFSEIAFYFLRDFFARVAGHDAPIEKAVLAVPGSFLKDESTEELKVGLLLGMAVELKLPVAAIVDMACAAVSGIAARELPRNLPVVHLDLHLHGTELSLLRREDRLVRHSFQQIPQLGYVQIMRHLKNAMSNRFLRHTAFDIHEDRSLEQGFFEQTKEFLLQRTRHQHEFVYQINTERRSYQMAVTRTQLVSDLQGFVQTIAQAAVSTTHAGGEAPGGCALTLSDRAARIDGLEARLRQSGFTRIIRLRPGAAAVGAAAAAAGFDLCSVDEVPAITALALSSGDTTPDGPALEAFLKRCEFSAGNPLPSHVILDGVGYSLRNGELHIGTRGSRTDVDVALPASFDAAGDYVIRIAREGQKLWLELPSQHAAPAAGAESEALRREEVNSGDRLVLRAGNRSAEMLFAHCPPGDAGNGEPSRG